MARRRDDLEIHTTCFDPEGGTDRIAVRRRSQPPLYRVFLFVTGQDLPYVDSVTYVLHPTFESPRRTVQRTPDNPNCKLQTWAWGEFEMVTEVHFKNGDTAKLSHRFSFAAEVAAAKEAGASRFASE